MGWLNNVRWEQRRWHPAVAEGVGRASWESSPVSVPGLSVLVQSRGCGVRQVWAESLLGYLLMRELQ